MAIVREDVAAKSEKQDKHLVIQDSFNRLSSEIDNLESLIDRIKGTTKEDEKMKEVSTSTLGNFLADGNIPIVDMRERISKINIALRELLF